jgi:hypothetical protein
MQISRLHASVPTPQAPRHALLLLAIQRMLLGHLAASARLFASLCVSVCACASWYLYASLRRCAGALACFSPSKKINRGSLGDVSRSACRKMVRLQQVFHLRTLPPAEASTALAGKHKRKRWRCYWRAASQTWVTSSYFSFFFTWSLTLDSFRAALTRPASLPGTNAASKQLKRCCCCWR